MQKLTVVALTVAFAGTASAAGWRDLRVDGSSGEAFSRSMSEFKDALSTKREYVFGSALKDIWVQAEQAAAAGQREYTADEYFKLLDGLRYEDVVNYTDPTGDTARTRYRNAPKQEGRSRILDPVNTEAMEAWRKVPPRDSNGELWPLFPDTPRGGVHQ